MLHRLWPVAALAAGLASGSMLHSQPAKPAVSQCRAGEAVIYSCKFGKSVGSVCGAKSAVHYRYGPLGQPALDLVSRPDWSNVRVGTVRGQGAGGYQEHVRFSNGQTHYIVFKGQDGELADRPGRTYSGISVQSGPQGETTLASLSCSSGSTSAGSIVDAVNSRSPDDADLSEEADGPFDAWF